jgi:hypothetical protein
MHPLNKCLNYIWSKDSCDRWVGSVLRFLKNMRKPNKKYIYVCELENNDNSTVTKQVDYVYSHEQKWNKQKSCKKSNYYFRSVTET